MSLDPKSEDEKARVVREAFARYGDPKRKWQNEEYLGLGIREHKRLAGVYPVRDTMAAWLYHAYEPNDELASSVAFLRDSRALGFTLDEAEDNVIPLIRNSHPSLPSSSIVGDMRLAVFGQSRVKYLAYSRKMHQAWKFLDEEAWRLGRIAALTSLLGRPKLYFREEFERELAGTAKENMLAELGLLGWTPPQPEPPEPQAAAIPEGIPVKVRWIPLSEIIAANEEKRDGDKNVPNKGPDAPEAGTAGNPPGPVPGGSQG